jgi:hypothetical protein
MADWIVQTRGKYRGSIGVIVSGQSEFGRKLCRFGSDGPSRFLSSDAFRKATQSEIAEKLGCSPRDLPSYLKEAHPA